MNETPLDENAESFPTWQIENEKEAVTQKLRSLGYKVKTGKVKQDGTPEVTIVPFATHFLDLIKKINTNENLTAEEKIDLIKQVTEKSYQKEIAEKTKLARSYGFEYDALTDSANTIEDRKEIESVERVAKKTNESNHKIQSSATAQTGSLWSKASAVFKALTFAILAILIYFGCKEQFLEKTELGRKEWIRNMLIADMRKRYPQSSSVSITNLTFSSSPYAYLGFDNNSNNPLDRSQPIFGNEVIWVKYGHAFVTVNPKIDKFEVSFRAVLSYSDKTYRMAVQVR
jgi:hypothetical protein